MAEIAVIGCTGFIGSCIYKYLTAAGYRVRGGSSQNCNLLNRNQVQTFFDSSDSKVKVVFLSTINKSVDNSYEAMIRNLEMVNNFMQIMPHGKISGMIFFSSADVYGLHPKLPVTETTLPNPANYYGIAKLGCERLLQLPDFSNFPITVLRLPGVYGFGNNEQSIVGRFSDMIRNNKQISMFGDGSVLRDYVEVGDVCEIVQRLIEHPFGGVLNVATGSNFSIRELINTIAEELKLFPDIEYFPKEKGAAGDLIFDVSLLKTLFPDLRMKSLVRGIRHYLRQSS